VSKLDCLAEIQVNLAELAGEERAEELFRKFIHELRLMSRKQAMERIIKARNRLRQLTIEPRLFRPEPVKTKINMPKNTKMVLEKVPGEFIANDFTEILPNPEDLQPVNDVPVRIDGIGSYPYPASKEGPVPDVPVRIDNIGTYPYTPPNAAPEMDPQPFNMGNIGTLLPPRTIQKPWLNASQQLFHPGDFVINVNDQRVGLLKAIRGEEATVVFKNGEAWKMPMQELRPYYGTVRELKKVDKIDKTAELAYKLRLAPGGRA